MLAVPRTTSSCLWPFASTCLAAGSGQTSPHLHLKHFPHIQEGPGRGLYLEHIAIWALWAPRRVQKVAKIHFSEVSHGHWRREALHFSEVIVDPIDGLIDGRGVLAEAAQGRPERAGLLFLL
eukprot:scaffold1029_cov364-Pinguiococcus_pyrenoidosus.AAC.11